MVALLTALLMKLTPSWVGEQGSPRPGYIFVNLGYSFLAAAAGGYVTSWVAAANPMYHVMALGMIVLVLAALSAVQQRGKQPIWYQLALVAITPLGVLAGGLGVVMGANVKERPKQGTEKARGGHGSFPLIARTRDEWE